MIIIENLKIFYDVFFLYLLIFVRPFYFVLKNKNWLIIIFAKQRQQIIMMVFQPINRQNSKNNKKMYFYEFTIPKICVRAKRCKKITWNHFNVMG